MVLGQHLLIECEGDHSRLEHAQLKRLLISAAQAAGATVLFDYFHQFGGGGGMTGVVVLAESHITVHQWPEENYAAFDVFMCGDSNPMEAAKIIVNEVPGAKVCIKSAERGHPSDSDSEIKFVNLFVQGESEHNINIRK